MSVSSSWSPQVEISPGGIGFIRTSSQKVTPNAPKDGARRKSWLGLGLKGRVACPACTLPSSGRLDPPHLRGSLSQNVQASAITL